MSNQTPNNDNYEMPTTDPNSVGTGNPLTSSNITEIIEATGKIDPSRFWMVFMVGLSICLGAVIFFGGGYLTDEIKDLKQENKELQVKLFECPDKTLERFKKQQTELNDLKNDVLHNAMKLDSIREGKKKTLQKLETLEKMQ